MKDVIFLTSQLPLVSVHIVIKLEATCTHRDLALRFRLAASSVGKKMVILTSECNDSLSYQFFLPCSRLSIE